MDACSTEAAVVAVTEEAAAEANSAAGAAANSAAVPVIFSKVIVPILVPVSLSQIALASVYDAVPVTVRVEMVSLVPSVRPDAPAAVVLTSAMVVVPELVAAKSRAASVADAALDSVPVA